MPRRKATTEMIDEMTDEAVEITKDETLEAMMSVLMKMPVRSAEEAALKAIAYMLYKGGKYDDIS